MCRKRTFRRRTRQKEGEWERSGLERKRNVAEEEGSLALIPAIIEIRIRHVPREGPRGLLCPRSIAPSLSTATKQPGRSFGTSREKVKCSRDASSAWIRDLPQLCWRLRIARSANGRALDLLAAKKARKRTENLKFNKDDCVKNQPMLRDVVCKSFKTLY